MSRLWTIGHSNHGAEKLLALLEGQGIACVVDVRSAPYSRRNPQHNRESMKRALAERGIGYLWEGEGLGGRPDVEKHPEFADSSGLPDWGKVAASDRFREALARLHKKALEVPTAILCAEENPRGCHRLHLVSAAWAAVHGEGILHIRGDGRVETHAEVKPAQLDLFG